MSGGDVNCNGSTIDIVPNIPYIMGIDEAGRGPVLGPLVYGCSYCPAEDSDSLKRMGFADSKTLSESQRNKLFDKICNATAHRIGWEVIVLSPEELSQKMLRISKYNLNAISHDTAIQLIKQVMAKGVDLREVYLDTVGDPGKYQAKLQRIFPSINKIVVSKKADSLFPIVSAASICAKVIRDDRIKNWKFKEDDLPSTITKFGSGYPADPIVKKWLKDSLDPVFGFPSIVRFSWKTCSTLLKEKGVPIEWKGGEDEEEEQVDWKGRKKASTPGTPYKSPATKSTTQRFSPYFKPNSTQITPRYKYFSDNGIHLVSDFD
eukprot:TRINITY_DN1821_c0_g1_i1.p1 TRINITY_DN1821_c0_g1~~TRINITY_DN1821_c0_g1_i1.p1  ORF type:complete len:374 (-),score=80.21 TRINITY_DN1821_c0_g1_i1:71-1027(-)